MLAKKHFCDSDLHLDAEKNSTFQNVSNGHMEKMKILKLFTLLSYEFGD